jgi:aryl-alcohol dehydrogenase-like predicted oxidoreductase
MMMSYRLCGRSGLRVSELALGTMTFGTTWGWGADEETCRRMVDVFAEAGGTVIDTANNYTDGESERIVGACVRADRDHFVVATKFSLTERRDDPNFGGNGRKNLIRSLEASLRRMDTDYVDLLWLHMWDFTTPLEEVLRALDDQVRLGKVHHIGFSDTPAWVVARAVALAERYGWTAPVAVQAPYSVLDRDIERDLLPMAAEHDLALFPWGLLEGGALSGKHLDGDASGARVTGIGRRTRAVVELLRDIGKELDAGCAQVALAWVRQRRAGAVIVPIFGARTVAQLESNLESLRLTLPDHAVARVDAASDFHLGFPMEFLTRSHILDLIHGDTAGRLQRHRGPEALRQPELTGG